MLWNDAVFLKKMAIVLRINKPNFSFLLIFMGKGKQQIEKGLEMAKIIRNRVERKKMCRVYFGDLEMFLVKGFIAPPHINSDLVEMYFSFFKNANKSNLFLVF